MGGAERRGAREGDRRGPKRPRVQRGSAVRPRRGVWCVTVANLGGAQEEGGQDRAEQSSRIACRSSGLGGSGPTDDGRQGRGGRSSGRKEESGGVMMRSRGRAMERHNAAQDGQAGTSKSGTRPNPDPNPDPDPKQLGQCGQREQRPMTRDADRLSMRVARGQEGGRAVGRFGVMLSRGARERDRVVEQRAGLGWFYCLHKILTYTASATALHQHSTLLQPGSRVALGMEMVGRSRVLSVGCLGSVARLVSSVQRSRHCRLSS